MALEFYDAEQSVIGSILVEPNCLPKVRAVLSADDFQIEPLRTMFIAACKIADNGGTVDPVTIRDAAGAETKTMATILDLTPTAANVMAYAELAHKNATLAKLVALGEQLQMESIACAADPTAILVECRAKLDALSGGHGQAISSSADTLSNFMLYRQDVASGTLRTLKTGFPSIDGILGGLASGGLYIIAARPGIGKSALSLALADMLAKERRVLFVSLEMSCHELNARRIASITGIGYNQLLFGSHADETEWNAVALAGSELSKRNLFFSTATSATVAEVGLWAQRVKAEVAFVDYLGLLKPESKRATEYERVTEISGALKQTARRLNIPVLSLCQLNRGTATEADHRPSLTHLRSSGALEQDADGVLLLHRPDYYAPQSERCRPWEPQQFEISVAKNRHGATGTATLNWYAATNRFVDSRKDGKHTWDVCSWKE